MQKVVALKKDYDKDLYYFLTNEKVKIGTKVVAFFDDFQTIAKVVKIIDKTDKFHGLPQIKKVATQQDIDKYKELKIKAKQVLPEIKKKSLKLGLSMKFVGAIYSQDASKITIIFSSEDRVDFRQFLKDLASMLKTRIELKQIGQRDEVKICGGVGPCGEECCCFRFLKDFEHVSVKMAKTQGLSLSPTKINGICGRLMCCLAYESSQYEEVLSRMPKIGAEINTPNGKGVVVYNDILRERVSIKRTTDGDSFVVEDFALEEILAKPFAFKHKNDNFKSNKIEKNKSTEKLEVINEVNNNEKIHNHHNKFRKDKFRRNKNHKKQ